MLTVKRAALAPFIFLVCLIPIVTLVMILSNGRTIGLPKWAALLLIVPYVNLGIILAVAWRLTRVSWGHTY